MLLMNKFHITLHYLLSCIASILSAYDDLIENNLKRIKLLEDKAQLLYKELIQEMSFSNTRKEEYIKDCLYSYIGGGWGQEEYKRVYRTCICYSWY